MKFFTKKRVVLFLLFIFPLICFLILSTGENNFKKLPILTEAVLDISEIDASKKVAFKEHVSIVIFIGNDISKVKSGIFNFNEKIYKKFFDYKKFQVIGVYPLGKEVEVEKLKNEIGAFTDLKNWRFVSAKEAEINGLYTTFSTKDTLVGLGSSKAFIVDKNVNLRGRTKDEDTVGGKLYGYNMNAVAELNGKMKDDISVLFYEYYAAFRVKNKNKADRKEVGL